MRFAGTWKNQYGSVLKITGGAGARVWGSFRTALADSAFFGQELPVSGLVQGDCISFAFATGSPSGDVICSFTGRIWNGKLETVWFVVSAERAWPHAVQTNADTFEKMNDQAA